MILSVSEAARRVGVSRPTLYKMRDKGKISMTIGSDGKPGIDPSELYRVFPNTVSKLSKVTKDDMPETAPSTEKEHYLQEKVKFLENQLALEQERVTTLIEINKNNSEKLLLTHQEEKTKSLWKKIFG